MLVAWIIISVLVVNYAATYSPILAFHPTTTVATANGTHDGNFLLTVSPNALVLYSSQKLRVRHNFNELIILMPLAADDSDLFSRQLVRIPSSLVARTTRGFL